MDDAVFEKTMENVRDRIEIKIAYAQYFVKYVSKLIFYSSKKLADDKMVLLKLSKKPVHLNKPIHAGLSILKLSKHHTFYFR